MESALSKYLFVYSSLRKGFHQAKYDYITQHFSFVAPVRVKGVITDCGGEFFVTPARGNTFIKGELYLLKNVDDFSWVFGQLDDYEGLIPEEGEQPLYRRELTKAFNEEGSEIDAWIYWYNGDVKGKPVINEGKISDYNNLKNH